MRPDMFPPDGLFLSVGKAYRQHNNKIVLIDSYKSRPGLAYTHYAETVGFTPDGYFFESLRSVPDNIKEEVPLLIGLVCRVYNDSTEADSHNYRMICGVTNEHNAYIDSDGYPWLFAVPVVQGVPNE